MQQLPVCRAVQGNYPRDKWELSQFIQSACVLSCQSSSLKRLLSSLQSASCLTLPLLGPSPGINQAASQAPPPYSAPISRDRERETFSLLHFGYSTLNILGPLG